MTKELSDARNIKDRLNRQVVVRTLTRIKEKLGLLRNTNGLILFAGINEFNDEIMEVIDLKDGVRLDVFHYNCSKKFDTDIAFKYVQSCEGSIVFANGNECMIYSFEGGTFTRKKHLSANLQKRQRKGGMSSLRIARLAEESRHNYVVHAIDYLNQLVTKNNWIFGSNEIVGMITSNKTLLTPLKNGGFLDFNAQTIKDQRKFLGYLKGDGASARDCDVQEKILYYLDTNPDMLDFDMDKRGTMKAYLMISPEDADIKSDKYVPLLASSVHYARLHIFEYIGLKYYAYDAEHEHEEDAGGDRSVNEDLLDAYVCE